MHVLLLLSSIVHSVTWESAHLHNTIYILYCPYTHVMSFIFAHNGTILCREYLSYIPGISVFLACN